MTTGQTVQPGQNREPSRGLKGSPAAPLNFTSSRDSASVLPKPHQEVPLCPQQLLQCKYPKSVSETLKLQQESSGADAKLGGAGPTLREDGVEPENFHFCKFPGTLLVTGALNWHLSLGREQLLKGPDIGAVSVWQKKAGKVAWVWGREACCPRELSPTGEEQPGPAIPGGVARTWWGARWETEGPWFLSPRGAHCSPLPRGGQPQVAVCRLRLGGPAAAPR